MVRILFGNDKFECSCERYFLRKMCDQEGCWFKERGWEIAKAPNFPELVVKERGWEIANGAVLEVCDGCLSQLETNQCRLCFRKCVGFSALRMTDVCLSCLDWGGMEDLIREKEDVIAVIMLSFWNKYNHTFSEKDWDVPSEYWGKTLQSLDQSNPAQLIADLNLSMTSEIGYTEWYEGIKHIIPNDIDEFLDSVRVVLYPRIISMPTMHDIHLVQSQTKCSEDVARKALTKNDGDIVGAITGLKL